MIETNFNGQDVCLLNDAPNLLRGFQTDFDSPTDIQTSLTMRETRRPYASTLRTSVKATLISSGSALRILQSVLRGLKAQPVLFPFWPAVSFWPTRGAAQIKGGLMIAFKSDWSQYEIYEGGNEPGWPAASDLVAPLLWGFLRANHDLKFANVTTASVDIEFTESSKSAYALQFTASALTDGPTPAGYAAAPKLLPARPNFRDVTETLSIGVSESKFDFKREQSKTFYPHEVYRNQSAAYTLSGLAAISGFISWYNLIGGQGEVFWSAGSLAVGFLSADALAGDTVLNWVDGQVFIGDYICTFLPDGTIKTAKIQNVVGSVITLAVAFGVALSAGQPFYPLSLARTSGKLSIKWRSPVLAATTLRWAEVRPEAIIPGDEAQGQTIGRLAERAILFDFWRDYGNGTIQHWYFTNYEDDITFGGNVYKSAPFSAGDISTSLNLEDDSCEIQSSLTDDVGALFATNPLVQDVILGSEVPLNVSVYFADVFQPGTDPVIDVGGDPIEDVGGSGIQGV